MKKGCNGYIVTYGKKRIEIYADTSYQAHLRACEEWNVHPKKEHLVTVYLCERADGSEVEQVITS